MAWLVFPALLAAVVATTLVLLGAGWPPPAISATILGGTLALLLMLERLAPLHPTWNARPDRLDVFLLLGNRLVDVAVVAAALALVARLGDAGLALQVWPRHLPLPMQALLGILLAEAIRYALHRLSHRPGWLWRVHRTHHEPQRMYAMNGPRLHPANQAWLAIANVVPMLLLGAELTAVVLAVNVTVFFVLLQHANLRLSFHGWNRLLATPDVHRLHHMRGRISGGVNYGIVLLVFDRMFGSCAPATDEPGAGDIGLG